MLNEFLRWARFKRVLESDDASVYEMISTYWKWYCLHISQLQAVWHKRAVTCLRHSHVRTRPSRISNPCSAVYYRNILKMRTRNLVKTKYIRYTQNSLRFSVGFYSGNALARVQRVNEPADLWDITFAPADFEAFSTWCTRWFWGPELSFIEQTAPADPKF